MAKNTNNGPDNGDMPEFSQPSPVSVPRVVEPSEESQPVNQSINVEAQPSRMSRVVTKAKSVVTKVVNPVAAGVTGIATAIGIPAKALAIGLAVTTAVGVPVVGSMVAMNNTESIQTTQWVGKKDCENPVLQAMDNAKKTGGKGETEIPSDVRTSAYTITKYDQQGFYLGSNPAGVAAGTGQAAVHDLWNQKGSVYDDGIATIDGLFLVAVKPPNESKTAGVGNLGDVITFYLEDGTSFDGIVADSKGSDAENDWGHPNGDGSVNIVEFEVAPDAYAQHGNPGLPGDWHTELGDGSIRSFTNHGLHPDLASSLGSAGGAVANLSDLGIKGAAQAEAQCTGPKRNYDNSTLAAALASYSMSKHTMQDDGEESSPIYQEVCEGVDELGPGDFCASYHYHSCDRGVAAAVYWTGADLNFPAGAPANQYSYCESSPLWEAVTEDGQPVDLTDDKAKSMGLEPGDIGITLGDHILAYVGEEAVNNAYEQVIKGVKGADVGEPDPGSCMVSASAHQRGANIHVGGSDSRGYKWFRYKGDYPDKDKYKDLGSAATLASTPVAGTDCDCLECGASEEENKEISGIVEFAKTFLGQPYVWGGSHGKGPSGYDDSNPHGTDCSGLVLTAYYCGAGIDITELGGGNCTGHHGGDGFGAHKNTHWKPLNSMSEAVPGDIIVLPGHVVIYEGDGKIIENTGGGCREYDFDETGGNGYYSWENTKSDDLCGVFHWVGEGGTDTTSPSTSKAANSGNGSCNDNCFSGSEFDDVFVVGDSVIDIPQTQWQTMSSALKGATIDASSGRSWDESLGDKAGDGGMIGVVGKNAGKFDRYVIEAGINDSGLTYEHAKELYNKVNKTNTQVFFVNQYVTTNESANQLTNESIDKLVSENSNCFKVDWMTVAKGHPEYLSDVCHLTEEGGKAFAEKVKETLSQNAGCGSSYSSGNTTSATGAADSGAPFDDSNAGSWKSAKASIYHIADNTPPGSTATASGIPLSDSGLTCAVPIDKVNGHGSEVYGKRVQFKYNGKTCVATITDCGGFGHYDGGTRKFDITQGVADALGKSDWGVEGIEYRYEDKALDSILG